MDRGSDKHGPRLDEALKHETEGLVRSGAESRVEEWREAEPPGEDEPDVDRDPDGTLVGGTPPGMTAADVAGRAELAGYLRGVRYPATVAELQDAARAARAPDQVVALLRGLGPAQTVANANDLWARLGGGVEAHRF